MSGLGFELETKQSKDRELGRSRRAGWTKPGKIQGNPVLPLSISTLSLRGSNEAEIIKSNSVTQNTPWDFMSGKRTEQQSALQEPTPRRGSEPEEGL